MADLFLSQNSAELCHHIMGGKAPLFIYIDNSVCHCSSCRKAAFQYGSVMIVDDIVDASLHGAARRTDMATAAKIAGDLAYIDLFVWNAGSP